MAPLLRFGTAERGFAHHVVERHSPQAGHYSDHDGLVESGAVHSASSPVLLERRDSSDSSSGAPAINMPSLTASTKVLAVLVALFCIVVLAVAGLRLRKFLRSRSPKASRSSHLKSLSLCHSPLPEKVVSEKRNPLWTQTLLDFGYDGLHPPSKAWSPYLKSDSESIYSKSEDQYVGWAPQIRSWPEDKRTDLSPDVIPRPFLSPTPPVPAAVKPSRFSRLAAVLARSPRPSMASFDTDAVLRYSSAAPTPKSIGSMLILVPPASASNTSPETTPSPPKQKRKRSLPPIRVEKPIAKLPRVPVPAVDVASVPVITVEEVPQTISTASDPSLTLEVEVKSPTRLDSVGLGESFAPDAKSGLPKSSARRSQRSSSASRQSSSGVSSTDAVGENEGKVDASTKKLPRLVVVVKNFTPTLQDELAIRLGDVLRMTHEFRDGWCAVERLGSDGEQGVIPRFCVMDRPSIVPDYQKTQSITKVARMTFTGSSVSGTNRTT